MSKLEVIDELPVPPKYIPTRIADLEARELFCFVDGLPPNGPYPRIYYMKLPGKEYIQLSGPAAGNVYNISKSAGEIRRVHGTLRVTSIDFT